MEALADRVRLDSLDWDASSICGVAGRINTSAIICPQHRKARILAQMQEGDARGTRR
jgi:hypothetical protein